MTIRGPHRILLALAVVVAALAAAQIGKAAPNVVVFIADDLGANDIQPYGNTVVRTPNLNALARNSLLFHRAFAGSPTCSPSRASLYSGMLPFRNGAHANHAGVKQGVRTLPIYLEPLGYKVAIAGKFHVGPMEAFPFELIHHSDVPEPGHEGQGVLWTDLNMEPVDAWISSASKSQEPFLLVVADHSPHVYWPENSDYDASAVDVPAIHIDTEDTRQARARYYTDISKMDRNVGKLLESLERNHLADNTVVIFTSDQGPQWPFGKWNLYDYGVHVPLMVRWPGSVAGGSETEALVSLVDVLPTIVEIAGGTAPKQGAQIDGTSLLPLLRGEVSEVRDAVFASHTGDGTMNQSPMRMIRTTRYKYILNLAPETTYTTHIDKSGVDGYGEEYWPSWLQRSYENSLSAAVLWRYHNRPQEELYDVRRDPSETRNLAADPHYQAVLQDLRSRVAEWRAEQGDRETGVFQEPLRDPQAPPIAPYVFP
jgi:arylsulfatase A-like enzyme